MSTIQGVGSDNLQRRTFGAGKRSSFVLYPEKKLVVITAGKRVTMNDLMEYASLLREDPSFNPGFSEIADIRAAEDITLGADDMMKVADDVDPFSQESKRAFVVQTPSQAYAARMHKILCLQRNFQIFRSLQAAKEWIEN